MGPDVLRVVGAIIERNGSVFAARRNAERSAGGLWEFPGGKIEPGESPEEALTRELEEELGVAVSVGPLIDTSKAQVGELWIELSCYAARFIDADPTKSTDHDALTWIHLDELNDYEWAPGDIPIIERLPATLPAATSLQVPKG